MPVLRVADAARAVHLVRMITRWCHKGGRPQSGEASQHADRWEREREVSVGLVEVVADGGDIFDGRPAHL